MIGQRERINESTLAERLRRRPVKFEPESSAVRALLGAFLGETFTYTSVPRKLPTSAPVLAPRPSITTHKPIRGRNGKDGLGEGQSKSQKSVKHSQKGSKKASVKAGKKTSAKFGSTGTSNNGKTNVLSSQLPFLNGIAYALRSPPDTRTIDTKWRGQRFGGDEYGAGKEL